MHSIIVFHGIYFKHNKHIYVDTYYMNLSEIWSNKAKIQSNRLEIFMYRYIGIDFEQIKKMRKHVFGLQFYCCVWQ